MKKQAVIALFVSIIISACSIFSVFYILNNTEEITADTIGYRKIGSSFLMADDYNNKSCKVTYNYNGEEKEGNIKISTREVKPQYIVRINHEGNIVEYESLSTAYALSLLGIVCVIISIIIYNEEKKYEKTARA